MDTRRRLYHARINSHLTLEQIGVRTALSPSVLRHIDEGKFELLPSGVYARSYIRTFAAAVGVDPEAALVELEHLLPGAPDPLPALNAMRPDPAEWATQLVQRLLHAMAAVCMALVGRVTPKVRAARAALLVVREPFARLRFRASENRMQAVGSRIEPLVQSCASRLGVAMQNAHALGANDLTARLVTHVAALNRRLTSRQKKLRGITFPSIDRLHPSPGLTRCSAAVIDALLLLVVDAFLVLLVSWSSGIEAERLLTDAGWAVAALCALPIALYFVLFGGIAGSTLGKHVCSLITPDSDRHAELARPDHPLTLPEILRRTVKQ